MTDYKVAYHSYWFDWPDAVVVVSGLTGYIGAYPRSAAAALAAAYHDPALITPDFRAQFAELFEHFVFLPTNVDEDKIVSQVLHQSRCKDKKPAFVFQLTEACNLRCRYCYQVKRPKLMSAALADRAVEYILDRTRASNDLLVIYFGGEPLLAFDRIRQIHGAVLAAKPSATFSIVTNGTLFNGDMASFFHATKKLNNVQLSIDGCRDCHDTLRIHPDGTGSYDEIRRAVPLLARACQKLSVRVNVTNENRDSISALLYDLDELALHHNLDNVHVYLSRTIPHRYQLGEFSPISCDDFRCLRVEFAGMQNRVHRQSKLSRTFSFVGASCAAPYVAPAWIDTEGYLYDCQHLCGSPEKSVGHINGSHIRGSGPLNDPQFFFETLPRCSACRHKLFCGGPCPLQLADGITRTELCDEGFPVLLRARLDEMLGKKPTTPPRCPAPATSRAQLRPVTVAEIFQTTTALRPAK